MALQIPAGYGQMNLIWQAVGAIRPAEVTLGYHDAPGNDAVEQANAIYDDFVAASRPGNAAQMNNSWSFLGVRTMLMTESGPTVGEFMQTVVGTLNTAPVPSNCALLIRKNTAAGGRRNRGRMFMPPCNVAEVNVDQNGSILPATVSVNQTNWNNFVAALALNPMTIELFHTDSAVPTEITSLSVQTILATQRRRMR